MVIQNDITNRTKLMKIRIFTQSLIALFFASTAHAGATFKTDSGTLNLGVDLQYDYTNESNYIVDNNDGELVTGGRTILLLNGEKVLENNRFVGFTLNPAWQQYGEAKPYDMYIQFGVKNDWDIKAGRFKATNLSRNSPAGKAADTYVPISNTMMYRADIARGRTSTTGENGQIAFSKTANRTRYELSVQLKDKGETIIARPAIVRSFNKGNIAFGLEVPLVSADTDTFLTANDNLISKRTKNQIVDDGSAWIGTGFNGTYNITNDLQVVARAAYLIDNRIKNNKATSYTAGMATRYKNLYIAALYGARNAEKDVNDTEEWDIYAAYKFPSILDFENFDISIGAGYSSSKINDVSQDNVVGSRVRLKYIF